MGSGMTIEKAYEILSNGLVNAPSEHEWCVAFKTALETMRNYQKLQRSFDKIRAEIEEHAKINQNLNIDRARAICWCLDVIDKYKAEREK